MLWATFVVHYTAACFTFLSLSLSLSLCRLYATCCLPTVHHVLTAFKTSNSVDLMLPENTHFYRLSENTHFYRLPENTHFYRLSENTHFYRLPENTNFYRLPENTHFYRCTTSTLHRPAETYTDKTETD